MEGEEEEEGNEKRKGKEEMLMCKGGSKDKENGKKWEEKKEKKAKGRGSHTWFASSLGESSGLQGENYCTSPPRARVTSLTTLIKWKSVIAQTVRLSVC